MAKSGQIGSLDRRRALGTLARGVAVLAAGPALMSRTRVWAQSPGEPAAQRLGDGLHLLTSAGGANVLARTDRDGVLLVDGASATESEALLAAVSRLPGSGPVHTLFNTHWHAEQTGSNERLGREGATIIAQENTRLWLSTDVTWPWNGQRFDPLPEVAQPNQTFYDQGGELPGGVRYGYIPDAAHTDGDMYVYFQEENVLATGGAVSGNGWPVVDWWTGGWIGGIVGGLARLITLSDAETRIVPAHGAVLGRSDLEAQYEMYSTIYGRLSQLLNSGRSPDEAVEARPTQEFDSQMGNPDEFVRRAFESQWAYTTPDA